MKKIYFISLVSLVMFLVSCDSISPETSKAFVGEYWMKTTSFSMYQNEVVQEPREASWSPVSIYEENGKLYVLTDHFGAPDTIMAEGAVHQYILNYEDHPNYAPAEFNDDGSEESGIENVDDDGSIRVFLMNGFIWSIKSGAYLRSLPIQVKSGSEKVLNLYDFKPTSISLTSLTGEVLEIVKVRYEYGPIVKAGDSLTWEVVLPYDFTRPSYEGATEVDRVVHKNILYKR